jgi:chemotaxis signal transduction protein
MSTNETRTGADRIFAVAVALRRSFDDSFAAPATPKTESHEGMLAIRVGADPYALLLSDIMGLYSDVRIIAVPSRMPQFKGIVGLRGIMAPVYDLAALMHYPPAASTRWMVLAGGARPVGFAFEGFEAHLRVPAASAENGGDAGTGGGESGATRRYTRGSVRAAGALRAIIRMDAVMKLVEENIK